VADPNVNAERRSAGAEAALLAALALPAVGAINIG